MRYEGPYIDEKVEHCGVSKLRTLNATNLRDFDKTLVIQDNDKPLAVLLSYEQFLAMQNQLMALLRTLDIVGNPGEGEAVTAGLQSVAAPKSLAEVQKSIKDLRGKK